VHWPVWPDGYVRDLLTGQEIGINNQFWDGHPEYGVEQITFDDGTQWNRSDFASRLTLSTNGNDILAGTSGNDDLHVPGLVTPST